MTNSQSKTTPSSDGPRTVPSRVIVPVIGLERFKHGALERGQYLTVKLRADPTDSASVTHDFAVPFFRDGSPEEWLLFRKNLRRVFRGQNLTNGPSQYQMARSLLEGETLSFFDTKATAYLNETVDNM